MRLLVVRLLKSEFLLFSSADFYSRVDLQIDEVSQVTFASVNLEMVTGGFAWAHQEKILTIKIDVSGHINKRVGGQGDEGNFRFSKKSSTGHAPGGQLRLSSREEMFDCSNIWLSGFLCWRKLIPKQETKWAAVHF